MGSTGVSGGGGDNFERRRIIPAHALTAPVRGSIFYNKLVKDISINLFKFTFGLYYLNLMSESSSNLPITVPKCRSIFLLKQV